jgi:hypothetical protein
MTNLIPKARNKALCVLGDAMPGLKHKERLRIRDAFAVALLEAKADGMCSIAQCFDRAERECAKSTFGASAMECRERVRSYRQAADRLREKAQGAGGRG